MAYIQRPFAPDIPGSIVVPAHTDNVRSGSNYPKVNVLHTPEEAADDIEVTPYYFSRQIWVPDGHGGWVQRRASTHYYADNDGDLFQMVPEECGAIANGVTSGMPYPADTDPNISLNLQSRSIEIEGYAATIHQTMPRDSAQWKTVVRWVLTGWQLHDIPIDRAHNIGHYEVSNVRSDPGDLDIDGIVEDAQRLLAKEVEMQPLALLIKRPHDSPISPQQTFAFNGVTKVLVDNSAVVDEMRRLGAWPPGPSEVVDDAIIDAIPTAATL